MCISIYIYIYLCKCMYVSVYVCVCVWGSDSWQHWLWCIFCCLFCFWSFLFIHLPQAPNLFCLFYSRFVYVKVTVKTELWLKTLHSLSAFLLTRETTHCSLYRIHTPYLNALFSVRIFLPNIFIFIYWKLHNGHTYCILIIFTSIPSNSSQTSPPPYLPPIFMFFFKSSKFS